MTAPAPAVPAAHDHPVGIRVPSWVLALLGGGGIALGGSTITVGMGATTEKAEVRETQATVELRLTALENQGAENEEKLAEIRDNQLLICQALQVDCTR